MKDKNQDSAGTEAGNALLASVGVAVASLQHSWDPIQVQGWVEMVLGRTGRVVLTGMGKSGLIAQKISATLSSTGCPSFFLHPAEAIHGDLGMITGDDSVLALSNSGETEEVVRLLPSLVRLSVPLAAITAKAESSLGQAATWRFTYALPDGEGCPLDLAPMASTTLQLVWGDLLASCLMAKRGFTKDLFALNHPGGALGSKLLKVNALAHKEWPVVAAHASLTQTLKAMTRGRLGMTSVMDGNHLLGVITDGDLRRALESAEQQGTNPLTLEARQIMSSSPATIGEDALAVEAAGIMETRKITFLMVERQGAVTGVVHIHDLLQAKVL